MTAPASTHDRAGRLDSVQALRALAALLVLASHIRFFEAQASGAPLLPGWLDGVGGSGVDLFFVISGFIMVYVTRGAVRGGRSAGLFLYNRVTRIYPPVWLFTGAALIGFALVPGGAETDGATVLHSLLLWPAAQPPALGVAWTLIHEMYFYLVFSLFLLAPQRLLPALLALWGCVVIAGNLSGLGAAGPRADIVFHPMTLEFIAGAAAGLLVCGGRRRAGAGAAALGAALYGLAWVALVYGLVGGIDPDWGRTLLFAVPGALLVYGLATAEADSGWGPPRAAVAVGDWSYSLYLSHTLVLALLARLWRPMEMAGPVDNLIWMLVASSAALLVAALAFRGFERPMLRLAARGRKRLFGATTQPGVVLAARVW